MLCASLLGSNRRPVSTRLKWCVIGATQTACCSQPAAQRASLSSSKHPNDGVHPAGTRVAQACVRASSRVPSAVMAAHPLLRRPARAHGKPNLQPSRARILPRETPPVRFERVVRQHPGSTLPALGRSLLTSRTPCGIPGFGAPRTASSHPHVHIRTAVPSPAS